jgi:membrane protease YdiL (CAAX protease family)
MLIFIAVLFLLLIYNFISNIKVSSSYGAIYTPIVAFTLILGFAAILSKGKLSNFVFYGNIKNRKQLLTEIALAAGVGLIWVAVVVFNPFAGLGFSIVSPLPFSIAATSIAALSAVFVVGVIGPLIEETFVQSALIPTIASKLSNPGLLAFIGILGGVYFLFVTQVYALALVFFALVFVYLFSTLARKSLFKSSIEKFVVATLFGCVIFAAFHVYAYGNAPNPVSMMLSAGLFAGLMAIYNHTRQNTVGSPIIHSMNNTALAAVAAGLSLGVVGLVVAVMALIMFAGYEFSNVGRASASVI